MSYLRRKYARDQLATATSMRMASAKQDEYRPWRDDLKLVAGYSDE